MDLNPGPSMEMSLPMGFRVFKVGLHHLSEKIFVFPKRVDHDSYDDNNLAWSLSREKKTNQKDDSLVKNIRINKQ